MLGALALALCQLADGRLDGVCSLKPSRSVDLAAAALIVREAGAAAAPAGRIADLPLDLVSALARSPRPATTPWRAAGRAGLRLTGGTIPACPPRPTSATALVAVIDPEIRRNVVELDMVRDVELAGGDVTVGLALTVAGCPMKSNLEEQVRRHVGAVDGVESVAVRFDVMTPEQRDGAAPAAARRRAAGRAAVSGGSRCTRARA